MGQDRVPTYGPGAHEGLEERFDDSTMVGDIGVRGYSPIVQYRRYLVIQGWCLEELGVNVWRNVKL